MGNKSENDTRAEEEQMNGAHLSFASVDPLYSTVRLVQLGRSPETMSNKCKLNITVMLQATQNYDCVT